MNRNKLLVSLAVVILVIVLGKMLLGFNSKPSLSKIDQLKKSGIELFEKKDFERARAYFLNAKKKAPDDLNILYYLALSDLNLKKFEEAARFASESIKIDNRSDYGYMYLGKALMGLKQYKPALEAFRYSNKLKPFSGNDIDMGWCYLEFKQYKKAKKAFEKSNEQGENSLAYFGLGRVGYRQKDYKSALEGFRKAKDLTHSQSWKKTIQNHLGLTYAAAGNLKQARLFFKDRFIAGMTFEKSREGILVTEVNEGFPAQAAGLLQGDIITAIDGIKLKDKPTDVLVKHLKAKPFEKTFIFLITRENKTSEIEMLKRKDLFKS